MNAQRLSSLCPMCDDAPEGMPPATLANGDKVRRAKLVFRAAEHARRAGDDGEYQRLLERWRNLQRREAV